jgi:hypothetical protein
VPQRVPQSLDLRERAVKRERPLSTSECEAPSLGLCGCLRTARVLRPCTHARSHTRAHTRARTHTCAHADPLGRTRARARTHAFTRTEAYLNRHCIHGYCGGHCCSGHCSGTQRVLQRSCATRTRRARPGYSCEYSRGTRGVLKWVSIYSRGTQRVLAGYSDGYSRGTPDLPLGRERERVDERPQPRHDPADGEYSRSTASTDGVFFGSYYIYYSRGTTLPTESTPAVRQVLKEELSLGVIIFIIAAARPCQWRVLSLYGKHRRRSFLWGLSYLL